MPNARQEALAAAIAEYEGYLHHSQEKLDSGRYVGSGYVAHHEKLQVTLEALQLLQKWEDRTRPKHMIGRRLYQELEDGRLVLAGEAER